MAKNSKDSRFNLRNSFCGELFGHVALRTYLGINVADMADDSQSRRMLRYKIVRGKFNPGVDYARTEQGKMEVAL
jgi:hypothetical protein